jgi:hypothetical protein
LENDFELSLRNSNPPNIASGPVCKNTAADF